MRSSTRAQAIKKLRDDLRDLKRRIVLDAEKRPGGDMDVDWKWLGGNGND